MYAKILSKRFSLAAVVLLYAVATHAQKENMDTLFDAPHNLAYAVAVVFISIFVLIFFNRLIYYREVDANEKRLNTNAQLGVILRSCNARVWIFYVKTKTYRLLSETGITEGIYTPFEFSQFYDRDDFEQMRQRISRIRDGQSDSETLFASASPNKEHAEESVRKYEITLRLFNTDKDGRPATIIGLQRDQTDELDKRQKVEKLLRRFHTLFNSSDVDMMYYDKDGILVDINSKACETFGIKDRDVLLKNPPNLKDIPAYKDLDIKNIHGYRMSSITNIDLVRRRGDGRVPAITIGGTIYYDTIANPIFNEQGEMIGIYTSGRNVNEMVESYHRQQQIMDRLKQATLDIQDYVSNINYALQVSDMRLINYSPDTHILKISSDLQNTQYELTQLRCIGLVGEEMRCKVKGVLRRMDRRENGRIDLTLRTILHDAKQRKIWLSFSIIPMLSPDGTVSHYFGMCRNATEQVETEQLLKAETMKALETEQLKNAFLLNMSYEIRTPLNTVLGFAELFNSEHDPEDEAIFAEEIKKSSNSLLTLVNETLLLSRLDAHMIEMCPKPTDFALVFEGYCHMGWNAVKPGVKILIENPYDHLVIEIDEANLGQIIQRLCAHAAYYTTEGYVRAKYEYWHGVLTIIVEDTGQGIDASVLPHAFDRFVTDEHGEHCGTGLDLPIVKELTEQMGGTIEFQSEKGKGTTAWVSLPCKATEKDRKRDMMTTMI